MAGKMSFSGMTSERTRLRMVERLVQMGITDSRVLAAMQKVPRHLFVDEALSTRAYDEVSLPIGYGQTISKPYTVARMTELLLNGGLLENVLEIGTGCGYQTAILLAANIKTVHTIERLASILDLARRNLRETKLIHARLVHADGNIGLAEVAPYDGIIVTAASDKIPLALIEQLKEGGRLIMPVGKADVQYLWRIEKTINGIQQKRFELVKFVPLLCGKA